MKVIVTKDVSGVIIWKPGTKLELTRMNLNTEFWSKINIPAKNPVWTSNRLFRVLFSEKKVKKYFPELIDKLENEEKKEMYLRVSLK